MKKILLTLLISTSISSANFFQEKDKKLHIGVTYPIGLVASMIATKNGATKTEAFFWGLGSAIIIGLAKEAYDSREGGSGFDNRDMIANAIGGSLGAGTGIVLLKF